MRFHIENMTCGGCVRGVTKALTRLDPDATLQAELEAHTITVQTSAASETVTQALAEAGFPVST